MYKQDVMKLNHQNNNTTYRTFYSSNLKNVYLQHLKNFEDEKMYGFFVSIRMY
jgi:hypothetical protein